MYEQADLQTEPNLKSGQTIYKSCIQLLIDELRSLSSRNEDSVSSLLSLIRGSNVQIVTSGIGKSGIIAEKMSSTLRSLSFRAIFLHPVEALHGDLGILETKGLMFIFSNSGSTHELLDLLPHAKSRQFQVIGILGDRESRLARECDIVFDASIQRELCHNNLAPTTSSTISLIVADILAVLVAQSAGITKEEFAYNHPSGSLGKKLTMTVSRLMQKATLIKTDTHFMDIVSSISISGCGSVLVVDDFNHLQGIITDGDIRRAVASRKSDIFSCKASEICTKNPAIISKDRLAIEALQIMEFEKKPVNVIPVVDVNHKVEGVIRIHNIVQEGIS
ncbi:KpsF/GutQ family sugar-phosphate isomerase [Pseudobacteriovorax antillogorgiicola]|uniref:Arabinose-5-phosphate isomerase n=1 Tax=Pseudobacteriovorax antillogorgiicola TaxID=1513793 RepID=A0A1Y6CN37_9BACT|nr:KpsF/GutQ family sugar-phosphate isomerase [Pseudobacteriovorax antillogorgiicola]TCS45184.1 arabinose-5-phosphate isomerase [Pseudobacteriovorax antillogorgiicola]SMF75691.1 arabinose-5-phosphate isomerase [Pseudobacteriovorax antillogorgiicola]